MMGLLVAAGSGCRRDHERAGGAVQTQTIAPAAAQPAPNDAMTQTVDVEEGRSEEEGGVISQHGKGSTPETATAATATTTRSAATPKPKAKKSK